MPKDADLWFEESRETARSHLENIRDLAGEVSPGYRLRQRLSLQCLRDTLDKLIDEWEAEANADPR